MWKPMALFSCLVTLAACTVESPFGFRLPDGDAATGRQAFLDLKCNSCHEVRGIALEQSSGLAHVTLGGQTTRVRTYGELVTSIINPSHKIAPPHRADGATAEGVSLMSFTYLNDVMTVQQLVDLVAFLQPTYEVVQPPIEGRWYVYP